MAHFNRCESLKLLLKKAVQTTQGVTCGGGYRANLLLSIDLPATLLSICGSILRAIVTDVTNCIPECNERQAAGPAGLMEGDLVRAGAGPRVHLNHRGRWVRSARSAAARPGWLQSPGSHHVSCIVHRRSLLRIGWIICNPRHRFPVPPGGRVSRQALTRAACTNHEGGGEGSII